MELRNVAKCVLNVDNGDEIIAIEPGATADVDGRKPWEDHLFVKAGWLEIIEPKKTATKETKK